MPFFKTLTSFLILACSILTVNAQDFKFGNINPEELALPSHYAFKDAKAAILNKDVKHLITVDNEGFYILKTVFSERIKIYKDADAGFGKVQIALFEGESTSNIEGFTYNIKGDSVIKTALKTSDINEELLPNGVRLVSFTLPDIKEGSIIEYRYNKTSPYFENTPKIRLQDVIPIERVSFQFSTPKNFGFAAIRSGHFPYNLKRNGRTVNVSQNTDSDNIYIDGRSGDYVDIYEANLRYVPPITDDGFSGNINQHMTALDFELEYTIFPDGEIEILGRNWDELTKDIYNAKGFKAQLDDTSFLNDVVKTLNLDSDTDLEKLERIYDYVRNRMRWNGNFGVTTEEGLRESFLKAEGNVADINLLLLALLKKANLSAQPILVSTKSNGFPLAPRVNAFNYIILKATIDGKLYYMDASAKLAGINILEEEVMNWRGRLINTNGTSDWIGIYPYENSVKNTFTEVNLNANSITGNRSIRYTGNLELNTRKALLYAPRSKQDSIKATLIRLPKVENSEFKNLESSTDQLKLFYDFSSEEAITKTANGVSLNLNQFFEFTENPFQAETRKYPIDFGFRTIFRQVININIPDDVEASSIPQNLNVSTPQKSLSYDYQVNQGNGNLQISTVFKVNAPLLDSSAYNEVKAFFNAMIAQQKKSLLFRKK